MRWFTLAVVGAFSILGVTFAAAAQEAPDGNVVFDANCASCHQSGGAGLEGVFPPLAGNPKVADAGYVEEVVRNGLSGPIEVFGTAYDGVMTGIPLDDAEVSAVVAYVQTLSGGSAPPPTTAAPPGQTAGDVGAGERLFDGSTRLENGGPACAACHAAGTVAGNGGRGLGPDLTDTATKLGGAAGITGWLASPAAYPGVMRAVFEDRAPTDGEIADLAAFLATTPGSRPSGFADRWLFAGLGLIGVVVLLGLMYWLIRGPNQTYNERLRSAP